MSNYSQNFQDTGAAEEFCLIFNNLFDIMNARSQYGKYFKRVLQRCNEEKVLSELVGIKQYILHLKGLDKVLICDWEKTGFIGFVICIESLILMYSEYALSGPLRYILTYKLSQDHLEVFCCAIRCKSDYNYNPSAIVFKSAYKWLLMHTAIKGTNGKCVELDQIPISILFTSSSIIPQRINEVNGELKRYQKKNSL